MPSLVYAISKTLRSVHHLCGPLFVVVYQRPTCTNKGRAACIHVHVTHHPPKHATHDGNEYAKEALQVAQAIALQEEEGECVYSSDETAFPQRDPGSGGSRVLGECCAPCS